MKANFRLKKHIPKDSTLRILEILYPMIDWTRVDFYEGLPWFTPAVAPYVSAQALPNFYSLGRYRIYLKKFDESRAQCLADIVHEAFHINQAMSFGRGFGLGFFRIWMVYYIAVFFRHGYRENPFEVPAFDQEFRFLQYCVDHNLHGIEPKVNDNSFADISTAHHLIFNKISFKYKEGALFLAGSFLFCLFISLTKPLIDALVFCVGLLIPAKKAIIKTP
jgi:hypothetical protein